MKGIFRRRDKSSPLAPDPGTDDGVAGWNSPYSPPPYSQQPHPQSRYSPFSSCAVSSASDPYSPFDLPLRTNSTAARDSTIARDNPPQLSTTNTRSARVPVLKRQKHHDAEILIYNSSQLTRMRGRHVHAPWYVRRPQTGERVESIYGLCLNCRNINFEYLFLKSEIQTSADPEDYIRLGPMAEIEKEQSCPFCVLVTHTVQATFARDAEGQIIDTAKTRKLLAANWYLTPFVYSHEQYGQGFQLLLLPNIREADKDATSASNALRLRPDWPYAVRLINGSAQGGRRVPAHQLDFEWIRSTFEYCDLSTDPPRRSFQHGLRAINVHEMCIEDLPAESDYVALSYCWGKVKMLNLGKENEEALRSPGSLIFSPNIPQTIRDAIVLVRNVGLQYLWVDSLCVIQDDPEDMAGQLQQMGEVYQHSYFTIFAISGQDVNYGLPGVRWDSRRLKQTICEIGDLKIANCLPWMEEDELVQTGAWGSRAWTYQERFRAQRGLFIGDKGMIINCLHTYGPEDQHCMHELQRSTRDDLIADGSTIFYSGPNKSCIPYLRNETTSFDMYAILVSEYSQRQLTFQSDAERACSAVFSYLANHLNCKLQHGMPDTEFDAALLWSPIGSSVRRIDPTSGKPQFPSWSWLGWEGHAAWPWQADRDTFCTTLNTPIMWRNALFNEPSEDPNAEPRIKEWFAPEELCLPPSPHRDAILVALQKKFPDRLRLRMMCDRARQIHPDWLSKYKIDWPNNIAPQFAYSDPSSHKITLRALSAAFYVVGKPFQRPKPYNVQHPIWRLSVIDESARLVGSIDIPDPTSYKIQLGSRLFVALSRSTVNKAVEPQPQALDNSPSRRKQLRGWQTHLCYQGGMESPQDVANYQHRTAPEDIDAAGHFDTEIYPTDRPWCMFNVMMLRKVGPASSHMGMDRVLSREDHDGLLFEREAVGRIHVDAFDCQEKWSMRTIELL